MTTSPFPLRVWTIRLNSVQHSVRQNELYTFLVIAHRQLPIAIDPESVHVTFHSIAIYSADSAFGDAFEMLSTWPHFDRASF